MRQRGAQAARNHHSHRRPDSKKPHRFTGRARELPFESVRKNANDDAVNRPFFLFGFSFESFQQFTGETDTVHDFHLSASFVRFTSWSAVSRTVRSSSGESS